MKIKYKHKLCHLMFAVLFAAGVSPAGARPRSLDIYFIDVDGGQSTLVVSPSGESLLIDTGFAGAGTGFKPGRPAEARDANRIVAAARDAGIKRINYLLITHFHDDHDGGVRELSQLMPIDTFIDHGAPSPQVASNTGVEQLDAYRVYMSVRSGAHHLQPALGTRLPLKSLEVTVVSSAGEALSAPLKHAGAVNPACPREAPAARDPYENPRSTGVVIRYGKFRFLDVGDLSGPPLFDLACPRSIVGTVDVYLVPHHGGADVAYPATFAAFRPRVAVMNNGWKKGGSLETYSALHEVKGIEDVWQLHLSEIAKDKNFPVDKVANLDETTAYWLKLSAKVDGSFEMVNARTLKKQLYDARR